MNHRSFLLLIGLLLPIAVVAQEPTAAPANPLTLSEKGFYTMVSGEVMAAAQKMPEENYSFKPTPDVRSFGQLVAHVADAQYLFCATAAGESVSPKGIEKTKTSKAEITAALKEAVDYCTKAYTGMTDAQGSQMVKLMGFNLARLTVLSVNTAHTDEHYGNMVTYLRLKGIVPPSSEKSASQATK
jgi:uncharacterized damage-inducible protein DinB